MLVYLLTCKIWELHILLVFLINNSMTLNLKTSSYFTNTITQNLNLKMLQTA